MDNFSESLDLELLERIDVVVDFFGYNSRKELIESAVRRFIDKYYSPYIKARARIKVADRDP